MLNLSFCFSCDNCCVGCQTHICIQRKQVSQDESTKEVYELTPFVKIVFVSKTPAIKKLFDYDRTNWCRVISDVENKERSNSIDHTERACATMVDSRFC